MKKLVSKVCNSDSLVELSNDLYLTWACFSLTLFSLAGSRMSLQAHWLLI